jgi:hypothetical protein
MIRSPRAKLASLNLGFALTASLLTLEARPATAEDCSHPKHEGFCQIRHGEMWKFPNVGGKIGFRANGVAITDAEGRELIDHVRNLRYSERDKKFRYVGAKITSVNPMSPAELYFLAPGEVLFSINDRVFQSADDMSLYVASLHPNSFIHLGVLNREGATQLDKIGILVGDGGNYAAVQNWIVEADPTPLIQVNGKQNMAATIVWQWMVTQSGDESVVVGDKIFAANGTYFSSLAQLSATVIASTEPVIYDYLAAVDNYQAYRTSPGSEPQLLTSADRAEEVPNAKRWVAQEYLLAKHDYLFAQVGRGWSRARAYVLGNLGLGS